MQVQSLGWKDPLEEGMVTHSSILAWRISWTEEPAALVAKAQTRLKRLSSRRRKEGQTEHIDFKGSEAVACDVVSENPQN